MRVSAALAKRVLLGKPTRHAVGLALFLASTAAGVAAATRAGLKAARERRQKRRSRLLSLPGDVLGQIFACLDPTSRRAFFHTARAMQVPQILGQMTWTVKLNDTAWTLPAPPRGCSRVIQSLLLDGKQRERGLWERFLLFDTVDTERWMQGNVHLFKHFLKCARKGTPAWDQLRGLTELRIKDVWQITHPDSTENSNDWRPFQFPRLHTLQLLQSSIPTFVHAVAETQARELRVLKLDLSRPESSVFSLDYTGDKLWSESNVTGLLRQYVPALLHLSCLQVLHLRCQPAMMEGFSFAQLGGLRLKHLLLDVADEEFCPFSILFGTMTNKIPQVFFLGLHTLELKTLELHELQSPHCPGLVPSLLCHPPLSRTLETLVCDSLCVEDLPELLEGLPALRTIKVCKSMSESVGSTAQIAERVRAAPHEVQLLLGTNACSEQSGGKHGREGLRKFFILCNVCQLQEALAPFLGSASLKRLQELKLCRQEADDKDMHRLSKLFPHLVYLELSYSLFTRNPFCDSWYAAVSQLPSLRILVLQMPKLDDMLMANKVTMVMEGVMQGVMQACAAAQQQGRCLKVVLSELCVLLCKRMAAWWEVQFDRKARKGIEMSVSEHKLLNKASLTFECKAWRRRHS